MPRDEFPAPKFFPRPESAGEEGLIGIGGELSPEWLLDAYRHGIFPWPHGRSEPLYWFSPDPRAVIEFDDLHISRRLRRRLRSGEFRASCNQNFRGVMQACGEGPGRRGGTWIFPEMIEAYTRFHEMGHAHSVEIYSREDQLVGGVYGVAMGAAFAAESMFYRQTDASKAALVSLVAHLRSRGFTMLDIQQWTEHTGSLGATTLPRRRYLRRLAHAVDQNVTFGDQLEGDVL